MRADTVAAVSTAQGEGGIGVIRISGDRALEIADKVFKSASRKKLTEMKGYTATYGKICNGDGEIDEGIALVFRAPESYTGEDVAELSCHGGIYITKLVLRAVLDAGAAPAEAGEFTKRAFLNGKTDLTEAESVMDLISAKNKSALRAALCVRDGALRSKINAVNSELITLASHLSAWADYPEENIDGVTDEEIFSVLKKSITSLDSLLDSYDSGQAVKKGIDAVIAGRPNAGKSTLMNMLSGCEKSIVTDIPGTTRDVVESTVVLGDVILNLSDTAGIRSTDDRIEKIGVERTKKRLADCGLLIAVFDSGEELDGNDMQLLKAAESVPCIAVINKTDLESKIDYKYIESKIKHTVYLSAISGEGVKELKDAVNELAGMDTFNPSEGILSNERQRQAALNALRSLRDADNALKSGMTYDAVTVSLEEAVSYLLELTGEKASDRIIEGVFRNFCVGK